MTRKQFIRLADQIIGHNKYNRPKFDSGQIESLADFCRSQNPNFNRQRWYDYIAGRCGPYGGKVKEVQHEATASRQGNPP